MSAIGDGPGFWSSIRPQPATAWGPPIYASQVGLPKQRYIPPELTPIERLDQQMWRREVDLQWTAYYNSVIRFVPSSAQSAYTMCMRRFRLRTALLIFESVTQARGRWFCLIGALAPRDSVGNSRTWRLLRAGYMILQYACLWQRSSHL